MGRTKNTAKHPGWTGNTNPAKYGIDVNKPYESPGPSIPINSLLKNRAKAKPKPKGPNPVNV